MTHKINAPFGFSLKGSPSDIRGALDLIIEAGERIQRAFLNDAMVGELQVELVARAVCFERNQDARHPQVKAALTAMLDALVGCAAENHRLTGVEDLAYLAPAGKVTKPDAEWPGVGPCAEVGWIDHNGDHWFFANEGPEAGTISIRRWGRDESEFRVNLLLIGDDSPSIIDLRN